VIESPDLLVFDVDGTLHDAFAWWAPVIRRGLARFAAQEGLALEMPDDAAACAVVGMKNEGVWAPFLPAGLAHRWRDLRAVVLPMELDELRSGTDYLFAGVRPLLEHLGRIGVPVALASNCHQPYMDAIREGQGLGALSRWQFCLDSDGVDTKTDMLRIAVRSAGAVRAVMVGDREPDLEAAREAGLPFVWRVNERCDLAAVSDACWNGEPGQLLSQLGLPRIS
jgi:phosphoglycolate phosphatase